MFFIGVFPCFCFLTAVVFALDQNFSSSGLGIPVPLPMAAGLPWVWGSLREGCCCIRNFHLGELGHVYSYDGGWESQVGPHVFFGVHTGSNMPLIRQDEEEY